MPRFAAVASQWGCRRVLRGAARCPLGLGWARVRGPGGSLERNQGTAGRRAPAAAWVGGAGHVCEPAGQRRGPRPGLRLGSVPQTHRLPAQSQVRHRGATSLKAPGAEPPPHHVIAGKAGLGELRREPQDDEPPRGSRSPALPGAAPRLGAPPGARNFGHRLRDPLVASGQDGELPAACSVGMGGQSQAEGPLWGACVCAPGAASHLIKEPVEE